MNLKKDVKLKPNSTSREGNDKMRTTMECECIKVTTSSEVGGAETRATSKMMHTYEGVA